MISLLASIYKESKENDKKKLQSSGRHEIFYQLVRIMILAILMYIAYVYNEIFTSLNGILTPLGLLDVDFFYLCKVQGCFLK